MIFTPCSFSELELRGGSGPHEGNIYVNGQPVCDDGDGESYHFSKENAIVVCRFEQSSKSIYMGTCRMLGFHSGKPTSDSHFGKVTEDFGMDELRCTGSEASILDCAHEKVHDCGEDEGAGVICCECQLYSIHISAKHWL